MGNKSKDELEEFIIDNCDSTHLVVYFLRAERYYTTPDDYFCDIVLLARCPITGKLYSTNGTSVISGKILHYIGGAQMNYCLTRCVPKDFQAIYESWDSVANTIASYEGIEDMDLLKELIIDNFPNAKFKHIAPGNNKEDEKTLRKV